jgi:tRNA-specific 2-thiouridylase
MKTVYVGLSGGVDSSVSAALLKDSGYNVVGVYMQNWTQDIGGVECPWKQDLADAKAVAAKLDIPIKVFDFQKEYKAQVVDYMLQEYQAGRTPNPDVMCNQEIKFKLFYEAAKADGADLMATGHYARVMDGQLLRAADDNKDQTYFLYRVSEDALKHTLFPVSEYTKPQIRELAIKFDLPTAKKPDSQGICFVGEVGMREFLGQYISTSPGDIVLRRTKQILGTHDGAVFYTTGQRHGLGIGGGKPYYVIGKDMATNTVFVTDNKDDISLESDTFQISDCNWITGEPVEGKTYQVRTRHRAELIDCTVEKVSDGYQIKMIKPERAITPGQSAVIYDDQVCLGGGFIA